MRTVWKGTIGFGDFAVPVKAYTAASAPGSGLTQVHTTDGGRIRHKRICSVDGTEVPKDEVGKGYITPSGEVVLLTEEDLAGLPGPATRSIEIHGFVPAEQIDVVYHVQSYYLEPDSSAVKPYVLLGEALQLAGRAAVVTVALRQRPALGALRVRDQIIMLDTLHWPNAIRSPDFPFLHEDVDLQMAEVRVAANMVENLGDNFDPGHYTDDYSEALATLVEARLQGREVARPTAPVQDAGVTELLRALQDSAQQRAESGPEAARQEAVQRARAAASEADKAGQAARTAAAKRGAASGAQR